LRRLICDHEDLEMICETILKRASEERGDEDQ
jgi:hypothetical protein